MNIEERKRVLVIDDNQPLLKMLGDYLIFRGFDVDLAESGEEGLMKAAALPPDIILLDISMPGMGGIGFLKRIMLSNGTLRYPVLVFTARTTTADYFRGMPVDGFIAKPCDKAELVGKVEEILEKHRRAVRKTILVGEDDVRVANQLVTALRDAGFEVEEAATGPEVLEKAAVCLPDAILVKHILTGMNGDAVVSILQAMPRTQSIPVVLYDASCLAKEPEEEDRLRCIPGVRSFVACQETDVLLNAVKIVLHVSGPAWGAQELGRA